MLNYKINYNESKSKYLKLKYQSGCGAKVSCERVETQTDNTVSPCDRIEEKKSDISTDGKKICSMCKEDSLPSSDLINLCPDSKCKNYYTCIKCARSYYPCIIDVDDEAATTLIRGEITVKRLSCQHCFKPILRGRIPNCSVFEYLHQTKFINLNITSTIIMTDTINPHIEPCRQINKNGSIADAIFKLGQIKSNNERALIKIWRCSNKTCTAFSDIRNNYGIFVVEENMDCGVREESEEEHYCKICKDLAPISDTTDVEWPQDEFGFYIIDGSRCRKCPQCNSYISREGGCAHMTCRIKTCEAHFCYCCEQQFNGPNETYGHIRKLFLTAFPTNRQIERMCLRVKKDKFAYSLESDFHVNMIPNGSIECRPYFEEENLVEPFVLRTFYNNDYQLWKYNIRIEERVLIEEQRITRGRLEADERQLEHEIQEYERLMRIRRERQEAYERQLERERADEARRQQEERERQIREAERTRAIREADYDVYRSMFPRNACYIPPMTDEEYNRRLENYHYKQNNIRNNPYVHHLPVVNPRINRQYGGPLYRDDDEMLPPRHRRDSEDREIYIEYVLPRRDPDDHEDYYEYVPPILSRVNRGPRIGPRRGPRSGPRRGRCRRRRSPSPSRNHNGDDNNIDDVYDSD